MTRMGLFFSSRFERRAARRHIGFAALLLCFLCACAPAEERAASGPALLEPLVPEADITSVLRGDVSQFAVVEGVVVPVSDGLAFWEYAPLKSIHVGYGQAVRKGDLLAELNTEEYEGRLSALREQLTDKERGWAHENTQAEIRIKTTEIFQGDAYQTELNNFSVRQLRRQLEQNKQLQALEREKLSGQIQELEARYEGFFIRAPYDGIAAHIEEAHPGDWLPPGVPFVRVADETRVQVKFASVTSTVPVGMTAFAAVVDGVEYALEPYPYTTEENLEYFYASRNALTRFRPVEGADSPPLGKQTTILMTGQISRDVLYIQIGALRREGTGQTFVFVDENGARTRRNVVCGLESNTRVEILSGLSEGEMVYAD